MCAMCVMLVLAQYQESVLLLESLSGNKNKSQLIELYEFAESSFLLQKHDLAAGYA